MSFTDTHQDGEGFTVPFTHPKLDGEIRIRADKGYGDNEALLARVKDVQAEAKKLKLDISEAKAITIAVVLTYCPSWTARVPVAFKTAAGKVHPLAGEVAPMTVEWINKIKEPVLVALLAQMRDLHSLEVVTSDSFRSGSAQPDGSGVEPAEPAGRTDTEPAT